MAKTTITQITDDLDGSKDAEEVPFSYKGVDFTIDLSKKNQAAMEKALKPYLDAATRITRASRTSSTRATKAPAKARSRKKQDLAPVRQWAKDNGFEISERGRVPAEVLKQYQAATK